MTAFRIATPADDGVVRALLRETAMPSWADMAIEREPSSYDWAVIAEENGEVIGVYIASVIAAHVDGHPQRLGYLGGLRVRPSYRQRIRHLREGYASVPALAREKVPWWFTTIGSDNAAARRLLEAGVRGLPRYHFRGEYITFALPTSRGRRHGIWRPLDGRAPSEVIALHNDLAAQFQCSPVLDDAIVDRAGNFFVCDGGVAALWDQRAFKRIVAARYRTPSLIPIYNAYAKLARRIPLPPQGQALDHTFIAFFAMRSPTVEAIEDLLSHCTTPIATIGMHAENPLREIVQRFKPMAARSRVYAVSFDGSVPPNGRPAQPEAALL
ncbi:MAG TPA: hypothetical protein VI670_21295 [Thermoanaerobaculia bacterium]